MQIKKALNLTSTWEILYLCYGVFVFVMHATLSILNIFIIATYVVSINIYSYMLLVL